MKIKAGIGVGVLIAGGIALAAPAHADTDCGNGQAGRVTVGPDTSCAFGFAVQQAFLNRGSWAGELGSGGPVVAQSPSTGETYTMNCVQLRQHVECTGGNNARVDLW